jgi:hypothetical protein
LIKVLNLPHPNPSPSERDFYLIEAPLRGRRVGGEVFFSQNYEQTPLIGKGLVFIVINGYLLALIGTQMTLIRQIFADLLMSRTGTEYLNICSNELKCCSEGTEYRNIEDSNISVLCTF